jgi:glutamine amidotransferase
MSTPVVTVIDYGVGNLLSVQRGFENCGAKVIVTSDPKIISAAKRVVLPGVGAFPKAMEALNGLKLIPTIRELEKLGTPLLAICLGMQLLMDESDEFGVTSGLGLIPGRVVAVPPQTISGESLKIPHIGWSAMHPPVGRQNWDNTLLKGNSFEDAAYFVHSFMVQPSDISNQIAHVMYGGHEISAVISKNQITGCQFHPEKSGEVGLKILRRFCHD